MTSQADGGDIGRVLVVSDDRLNRECLTAQLAARSIDVGEAWDLASLLSAIDGRPPAVILLNIDTPDSASLRRISLDLDVKTRVVVFGLSTDRKAEIIASAEAGVAGLHLRSEPFEHLIDLLRAVSDGGQHCSRSVSAVLLRGVYALADQSGRGPLTDTLTVREIEILGLIEQGMTNQQIASRLSVTVHTVKNHVHSLLTKLGVGSRAEAVTVFRAGKYAQTNA